MPTRSVPGGEERTAQEQLAQGQVEVDLQEEAAAVAAGLEVVDQEGGWVGSTMSERRSAEAVVEIKTTRLWA